MAFKRVDRARMATATTGAGTVTLGAAVGDAQRGYFKSFSAAGIADGDQVNYLIIDGTSWELGTGTYTASGTTLSRTLIASSTGALLNLSGTADVSVAFLSNDLALLSGKGSDVASAGTVTLGDGSYFHITGTTTITDIDFAKPWDGRMAVLIFDGALTLTHNGTTLQLPGGANITTAAGDRAIITQDANDNVIVVDYVPAAGFFDAIAGRIRGRNRQTGTTYTFVLADNGVFVEGNNASAQTYTVPPNSTTAFPVGTTVINIGQYGAGQITIAAGAGVTIRSAGSKLKLTSQYSTAALVKIGTDEWWLFGDLAA